MGKRRSWAFALLAALVVAPVGKLGQTVAYLGAADFAKRLREDYEFKGRLVRELGLKPQ